MQLFVRYGYSTVAHEPIGSVVSVVMAHRNLARQRYQNRFRLWCNNPTGVSQLASLGMGVSSTQYLFLYRFYGIFEFLK